MDLSTQGSIRMSYASDPLTGLSVITFSDNMDNLLGSMTIETVKVRTFVQGVSAVLEELFPQGANDQLKRRVVFDIVAKKGEIFFG